MPAPTFTWRAAALQTRVNAAINQAVQETEEATVAYAKRVAPVDTGFHQQHIGAEVEESPGQTVLMLFADAPYAIFLELGTSKMAAQPSIRPAADAVFPRFGARLQHAMGGR